MPPNIFAWLREVIGPNEDLEVIRESETRIAKAYREYLRGYQVDPQELVKIVMEDYEGDAWIEQADIPFFSLCKHHFLPFFGTIAVRYKPKSKLIGIGKLPRVVECFAARLTMQEVIVKQIGDFILEHLDATSVEVTSSARHLCVEARGPKGLGSTTLCSYKRSSLQTTTLM